MLVGKPLCVGQVVDCCVLSFEPCELKTVPVTVNSDEVNKTVVCQVIPTLI